MKRVCLAIVILMVAACSVTNPPPENNPVVPGQNEPVQPANEEPGGISGVPSLCDNGIRDSGEDGIDCGGVCEPCTVISELEDCRIADGTGCTSFSNSSHSAAACCSRYNFCCGSTDQLDEFETLACQTASTKGTCSRLSDLGYSSGRCCASSLKLCCGSTGQLDEFETVACQTASTKGTCSRLPDLGYSSGRCCASSLKLCCS